MGAPVIGECSYLVKTLERVQGEQAEQGKAIATLNVVQAEHEIEINDTRDDVREIRSGQARVTAALYTLATSAILLALSVLLTR